MKLFINFMLWAILSATTLGSRNDNLVSSISQKQSVEVGSSVELECGLEHVPHMAEVAWVRMVGLGEVEYLSVYNKEEGVVDYDEDQFISVMDEDTWSWDLIITQVRRSMAGLYQCQVRDAWACLDKVYTGVSHG